MRVSWSVVRDDDAPLVRSAAVPSDDAAFDHGRRISAAMWTGEGDKRRRIMGGPSPRPLGPDASSDNTTDAMLIDDDDSDTRPQVQEEQGGQQREEEEFVFSAEDDIEEEERCRYHKELSARELHIYPYIAPRLEGKDRIEVYQRLCGLRFREYKILEKGSLDDTIAALPISDYPDEVFDWEDPLEPGPSMFGWTYDRKYFAIAELDDYQRILPTRADLREYLDWEKYRLTFSRYETDEEYVNYWDELSKKMKWVEDAVVDHKQFRRSYEYRGLRQAMKIAAGFNHLPLSLGILGYEEYVSGLHLDLLFRKDYDQIYFEVWKRVSKQEMTFKEALEDILSAENKLSSSCLSRIHAQIKGYGLMHVDYNKCMGYIRELVGDGGEGAILKKHFTDAVYRKIPRPKMYVDYAKKKLEIARRIHLNPGTGSQATLYRDDTAVQV